MPTAPTADHLRRWRSPLVESGAARCPNRPRSAPGRANTSEVRHGRAACRDTRCSTHQQDLTAQRGGLPGLGVEGDRIYVDHGLTGTNRVTGLCEALAVCRAGG